MTTISSCRTVLAFAVFLLFMAAGQCVFAAEEKKPSGQKIMVMGLLPSISPASLFNRYSPLVEYVNKNMKSNVVLETAPDSDEYLRRTNNRMYDLILTAPHFVVLALDSGKYELVAAPTRSLSAKLVVVKDSKVSAVSQLAGKVVATPDANALITKAGVKFLEENGLTGAQQPIYMALPTHDAAYHEVLSGQADAALISADIFDKAVKEGQSLKSIGSSGNLPGVGIMVARDLPQEFKDGLKKLLLDMKKSSAGKSVLKKVSHPGYKIAQPEEYYPMRIYLAE